MLISYYLRSIIYKINNFPYKNFLIKTLLIKTQPNISYPKNLDILDIIIYNYNS